IRFEDIGVVGLPAGEGLIGVTGTVVADEAGGRLQLDSEQAALTMPKLFEVPLAADALEGFLVWRATPDGVRVLSDNISVRLPIGEASSRFELTLPSNGESPFLDLTATAQVNSAPGVLDYLPLNRFSDKLSGWLRRSILAGRVAGADIEIRGPLRRFPFAGGDGVFRVVVDVADGKLDYAPGWPEVENLNAQLVFDGASFATRSNSANYGGLYLQDADVRIPNLREGMLSVTGPQTATFDQVLGFLRASPLADAVGPILDRVGGAGNLSADAEFLLPIKRPKEYDLRLDIDTEDAQLSLQRLNFDLTRITGSLTVRNTRFYADGLTAELLGEPVTVSLRPAEAGGAYAQFITMSGITPVRSWIDVLNLPQADRFDGAPSWQALTMIPARREGEEKTPLKIVVRSDLVGVESRLPAPLAKTADVARAFELGIAWPDEESLEIIGRFAGDVNWALLLDAASGRWRVERGNVHAGTAAALMPLEPGVALTGHVGFIRLDDWLALADGGADSNWQELYRSAELRADRLAIFGQQFPGVGLDARREGRTWKIAVDGPNLAGDIMLPPESNNDSPIVLDLERMWLVESDPGDRTDGDPREVPPVSITADEFVLGKLRFGSLTASMRSTPYGLEVEPINIVGPTFTVEGNAAWLVSPNDDSVQQSRLRLALRGTDIEAVLDSFGYQPVIEGETVAANVDLSWAGAPNAEFLYRADGSFSVDMQKGALLSLEPGGGRLLGILSVTALPRRLALDFRDVTDEGLGFDTLRGDFTLDAGNVYTCNLGLEGSVADMGIVGRTGLRDEDYDQLAVVRPHVSNLFALGGAVVAGPAAGAAMLLFSQVFRKPLSQLGESFYLVSGSWDDPVVKQLQGSELNVSPLKNCETYLEDALTASGDE
ncbi:MAG: YhdP family protein, partial [Gammaproteobacteria bacterium]